MLNGTQVGPYEIKDVQGWIQAGYVKMEDPAWYEGCGDWVKVKDIPEIEDKKVGHNLSGHLLPPFEAYVGKDPYIFISYAHKDSEQVFKEISRLHKAGYKIWYDEGIEASTEWPEEIANAVLGCAAFLVFVTPRSTASVNCRNEINLALNENKPFLAVHLEDSTLPPGLRLRMGDLQAILKYKNTKDRYQRKLDDSLDLLLGKKVAKGKALRSIPNDSSNALNSKTSKHKIPQKSGWSKWVLPMVGLVFLGVWGAYEFIQSRGSEQAKVKQSEVFKEGVPWTIPSIDAEMVWCLPGRFIMGSPGTESGRNQDEIQREIFFKKGFFIGKYEVTQKQWDTVMKTSPSKFKGLSLPVESVSWNMVNEFCKKLTDSERNQGRLPDGWIYQLPTEAQWEYACRAGTESVFPWGSSITISQANYSVTGLEDTRPVGSYPPNPWGIHDMLGNVSEWCKDWYGPFDLSDNSDPQGPVVGTYRVVRGNAWVDESNAMRVARRVYKKMNLIHPAQGFRICLAPIEIEQFGSGDQALEIEGHLDDESLVGWWKMDDGQGMVAIDSSGNQRHGELSNFEGKTSPWVQGPMGGALRFDGMDDFIRVNGYQGIGGSNPRSIVLWAKTSHGDATILSWGEKKSSEKWLMRVRNQLGRNGLLHLDIEGSYVLTDSLLDEGWNHLAIILPNRQNSVRSLNFYINGNPIGKNFIEAKRSIKSSLAGDLIIGKDRFSDYSNFQGLMDDLRIYDRAIQPAEVLDLLKAGSPPISRGEDMKLDPADTELEKGLVAWWKFDESTGLRLSDASGLFKNGALKGFTSESKHWVKGKVGNALLFDGIDDYIDLGAFRWGGEFSIAGWVQYHSFHQGSCVIDFGNGEAKQNIMVGNQDYGANLYFSKYYSQSSQTISYPDFWKQDEWVHFAVLGLAGGNSVVFKDGKLLLSLQREFSPEIFRKNQYLGKSNSKENQYFKGLLDEFRIYDRALRSEEVESLSQWNESDEGNVIELPSLGDEPDLARGLVAWWKFDELEGVEVLDSSGENRKGKLYGYEVDQKSWCAGPVDGALFFDGKNDFIDLVGFSWGGELSISLWAKFESPKPWARIFEFGDGRKSDNLLLSSAAEFSTVRFENWVGESEEVVSHAGYWEPGKWIHFTCSVNEAGETKLFRDTIEQTMERKGFAEEKFRRKKFIGKSFWSETSYFHGILDDFRLYDRAIMSVEVQNLFQLADFESLSRSKEETKKANELKEAELKAKDPNSRFSPDLLAAVLNWKKIPQSVFPLGGVSVLRPMQAKMSGDKVMAERNKTPSTKKLLEYADKGLNITNVDESKLAVSTYLHPEKQIIILKAEGDQLIFTMAAGSRMRGYLKIDDTNFKDKVAELFEMRKSGQ